MFFFFFNVQLFLTKKKRKGKRATKRLKCVVSLSNLLFNSGSSGFPVQRLKITLIMSVCSWVEPVRPSLALMCSWSTHGEAACVMA